MRDGPRAVGIALLAALAASQAALVVLNPLLPDVARDLGVSVATAGQLRTVSGLAAGIAALTAGLWATRLGLRELCSSASGRSSRSARSSRPIAPDFPVLVAAQACAGFGIGISYSAAVAATAEWATPVGPVTGARDRAARPAAGVDRRHAAGRARSERSAGASRGSSSRSAWPLVATVLLLRRPATPPATGTGRAAQRSSRTRASCGGRRASCSPSPAGPARSSTSGRCSSTRTASPSPRPASRSGSARSSTCPGICCSGAGWTPTAGRLLVALAISAAATVAVLYALRPVRVVHDRRVRRPLVHRRRSNARRQRARARARARAEAGGDGRADRRAPVRLLRRGGRSGGARSPAAGYSLVGLAFAALFVGAAIPHLVPLR